MPDELERFVNSGIKAQKAVDQLTACAICHKPPSPYPNWLLSKGHAYHVGCLAEHYEEIKAACTQALGFIETYYEVRRPDVKERPMVETLKTALAGLKEKVPHD